jgi:hypothetical protein
VLTRLNAIDGVQSSSALLANDGKRLVQIRLRPGAKETKVVEEVQRALRAEIQQDTAVKLEGKSADAAGREQDWRTIGQLNALASLEDSSARRFDKGAWLLALPVFSALGAFLVWLLRRQRPVRPSSEVRLDLPEPPMAASM